MEIKELIYISGKYTKPDYLNLHLQIDSPQAKWNKAIEIFEDRIGGRFFNPISDLLQCQGNELDDPRYNYFKEAEKPRRDSSRPLPLNEADLIPNGFAAMAVVCLLLETLMQFREGLPVTPRNQNATRYTKFMEEKLDIEHEDAERFYADIRCGILHSGETKNFSCLTIGQDNPITPNGRGAIKVDVKLMADRLRGYYSDYCAELRDGKDNSLRVKFIRKMDSITKKWENHQKMNSLWNAIGAQQGRRFKDSSHNVFSITSFNSSYFRVNQKNKIRKSDISDAVNFWDDKDAINIYDQWKYIVPLFEACREEADKFIIRAG